LPEKIANAPELWLGLELYYDAFVELCSCRPTGWSMCPIPWTVIVDYAVAHGIVGEQLDDLFFFVRGMDAEYLKYHEQVATRK
jgi:hypothetical protein